MNFSFALIVVMGALFAIVLGLIAASPGGIEGATQLVRSDEIPKLDRSSEFMSEETEEDLELEKRHQELMQQQKMEQELMQQQKMEQERMEKEMMEQEMMEEAMEKEMEETEDKMMETAPMSVTVSLPEGSGAPGCEATDECYIPYSATIAEGGTVAWSNDDTAAHTVTSGTPEDGPDGMFDSSLFMAGNTFEYTFEDEGTYPYFCIVHPWMIGQIIVVDVEETEEEMKDEMMEEEMGEDGMGEMEDTMKEEMMQEMAPMEASVSVALASAAPGCEQTNDCYIPFMTSISKGGTVTWANDDAAVHTVTSGTPDDGPDGMFDSGLFMAGIDFEFTFEEAGSYDYFCAVHPWMKGVVIVS